MKEKDILFWLGFCSLFGAWKIVGDSFKSFFDCTQNHYAKTTTLVPV